jgi:hypothetical protein
MVHRFIHLSRTDIRLSRLHQCTPPFLRRGCTHHIPGLPLAGLHNYISTTMELCDTMVCNRHGCLTHQLISTHTLPRDPPRVRSLLPHQLYHSTPTCTITVAHLVDQRHPWRQRCGMLRRSHLRQLNGLIREPVQVLRFVTCCIRHFLFAQFFVLYFSFNLIPRAYLGRRR